jgi:hypothetical protein
MTYRHQKGQEMEEGKLTMRYKRVDVPGGTGIDAFFEGFIQTNLKAFGYELISSGMEEDNTRVMKFDKMARH